MKFTSTITLLVSALTIGCWSGAARADQPIGLIQTLCMPEHGVDYFSARLESFNEIANYDVRNDDHRKVLEKYGLLPEDEFTYSCKLLNHTYTITGHRPPFREKGMCGGNPRTTITLKRDDEIILDNVFFEPSCFTDSSNGFRNLKGGLNAYVESFVVQDEINSDHGSYVDALLSDGAMKKTVRFNEGDHKSLDHDQLYCLAKLAFFDKGDRFSSAAQLEPYEQCQHPKHRIQGDK